MEKEINIETNDGKKIYGIWNSDHEESGRLLILVHGLSDHMNHRLVYNASRFFKRKGFDTYRPSLYSMEDDARRLEDCSIGTFVEDLNSVIYNFEDQYDEIFIIAHSLGFVVLDCDLDHVDGLVLWDPSLSLEKDRIQNLEYREEIDSYLINWGATFIIGKQLKIDWENINDERLLENLDVPTRIIMAGENDLKRAWDELRNRMENEYEYSVIDGASHGFTEEGKENQLFDETLEWLEKQV